MNYAELAHSPGIAVFGLDLIFLYCYDAKILY